jgi:hypothetical protein
MEVKKSGSFCVTQCLAVVTNFTAPETVNEDERKVTYASIADATNMWRQRFCHLGTNSIVAMSKKETVLRIPKLEEDKCESSLCSVCVLRKFDCKPFQSSERHFSKPCERIHMDIKVPMKVAAIGMFKSFLILVKIFLVLLSLFF